MSNIPDTNDANAIFDWAMNVGNAVAKRQKINELQKAVYSPSNCGECDKWMCSRLCPQEVHQKNGRYIGPSMNGSICKQFQQKSYDADRRKQLKEELDKLLAS